VRISVGTGGRLGSRPVGYLDWHEQPGYYRDITRHFPRDAKVLDIGCGSGWLGEHFEDYTGVDSMPEAAIAAAAKGRNVLHADVDEPLPFDDASFDGVILKDVLEHVRDPVAVVREARRVVRPGGRIFASSPDAQRWVWDDYTHHRPFTRKSFRLLFADNGFDVERVSYESVLPGTGIVSGYTRRKRRPAVFRALAWLPIVRRNVWLLARRSDA
jgi:SAM-dependent methyltransferase